MLRLSSKSIQHILCLGAHSDDIEIGCGGALLKWIAANPNLRVTWVVFSAAGERREEAKNAADFFLGGLNGSNSSVSILDFSDRYFPQAWADIKNFFVDLSSAIAPDLVLTHRLEDRHQDHRVISELTWNAFRNQLILEYEIAKYEGDLGQPNVFVPLSAEIVDRKVEGIMRSFPSQHSHHWFDEQTFRALMRIRGVESNSPTRYAEAFHCRKLISE